MKVVPEDLATAASLTENGQHLEMHPAEQIAGFRAMAAEGKTPAQTGDLLGYTPRHVQRTLKLAGLAPVILEALAEDKITTEHCQELEDKGFPVLWCVMSSPDYPIHTKQIQPVPLRMGGLLIPVLLRNIKLNRTGFPGD